MRKEKVLTIFHLAISSLLLEVFCDVSELNFDSSGSRKEDTTKGYQQPDLIHHSSSSSSSSSEEDDGRTNSDTRFSLISGIARELPEDPHTDYNEDADNQPNYINTNYNGDGGYVYQKPDIPFEPEPPLKEQPGEQIEEFGGYNYPRPAIPMTYPPPITTDQTFPEASARSILVK